MNYNRYKHYIVVNEDRQPMSFEKIGKNGGQFCFAQTDLARQPNPVKLYTYKEAIELIRKTVEYRTSQGFEVGEYRLMPIFARKNGS